MKQYRYRLEGLHCANCASKIESKIATLPFVQTATLQFVNRELAITAEQGEHIAIVQAVCDSIEGGITVVSADQSLTKEPSAGESHRTEIIKIAVAVILWSAGLIPALPEIIRIGFFSVAALLAAWNIAKETLEELKNRRLGENSLLIIALIAAFAIGEYSEGTLVALLFTVGELLEELAVARSRRQIEKLAEIRPDTAFRRQDDGSYREVPAEQVAIGDYVQIPAHRRIPVDGIVVDGYSDVDTSALTGESVPTEAGIDTPLLSGMMNGTGTLVLRATKRAGDSAASRILEMVNESAAKKGNAEKFITRFARVYTPVVTLIALLLAVVPPLLLNGEWHVWIYRALVFLVASCPCALVISIPLGFYAGIGAASRRGVLIKGGRFLESLAKADAAAFDKTGTLTTSSPVVESMITATDFDPMECLALAKTVESQSQHPLSKALCNYADEQGVVVTEDSSDLREIPGKGISAVIGERIIFCGSRKMMEEQQVPLETLPDASVYLSIDGKIAAAFIFRSALLPLSGEAIAGLRKQGVSHIAMLTGDNKAEAARIAEKLEIADCRAELLPDDKLNALREIKQAYGTTLFVGDGINDAPVLAEADVGIAMGLGSEAAIEAGDVVLMSGNLNALPDAIRLSKRVMGVIRFNLCFALGVKAIVLIAAALGYAPMWAAVFADVGVSVLSILNAVRLLGKPS